MTDRSGIEIDYCPDCRGVWLDRGELDKIIERSSRDVKNIETDKHKDIPMGRFFNDDKAILDGVPKYNLYLMRILFVLTFLFLGRDAWTEIFSHIGQWKPLDGVAYSFWAAYSTIMILGLRQPLKMIPLLLLQFSYKLIWLIAVAVPLYKSNNFDEAKELTIIFMIGVVLDILIIPWKYVFRNYFTTKEI